MKLKIKQISCFVLFLFFNHSYLFSQNLEITHGPYIQAVSENGATIVWTTNKNATSWVEIAPAGDDSFYAMDRPQFYQTFQGFRTIGCLHKIYIPNLEKGKEYRYRIFSKEVLSQDKHKVLYGSIASTDVYKKKPLRFRTLDGDKPKIEFSVVNDIHEKSDTLKALLKNVKYDKTDFVFFNGDMVSSMANEKQFFDGFMDASIELFAKETPMFYARGNHETRGSFNGCFSDYFPTNSGKLYYTFRQGPAFFVVLDCGEDKPDSDISYSSLAKFDELRSEQKRWLEEVVQTEDFKSAPYRVVMIHIPPYGTDWHGAMDIKQKFLPILNNANISIMLCGHMHTYKYYEPIKNELNFPVFLNAANTCLEVTADENRMVIQDKDTRGKVLNTHVISR